MGGGLGSTFGIPETYPRAGDVIGFCKPEQVIGVAEKVVAVQRDYGDRKDRKQARLKYTIDHRGLAWFQSELEKHLGYSLGKARHFKITHNGDNYGWKKGTDGKWHLTYFVEGGRVKNSGDRRLKDALREVAQITDGHFILTGNQNVILAGVSEKVKPKINAV